MFLSPRSGETEAQTERRTEITTMRHTEKDSEAEKDRGTEEDREHTVVAKKQRSMPPQYTF